MNFSCVWTVLSAGLIATGALAAPGPDCSPAVLQELPVRVRNMCAALYQFSNALQQYIEENPSYQPIGRDASPIYDSGVKRQDLDHVFLRFGRRR
uniref:Neuropeptide n=1 Tax=Nezara viridula TaxID=85310 RepID=A0A3S8RK81_NEZVI|nr:neuropeptide precursor [Nezara viridula]